MYCPNCAAPIDGVKFCRQCGANVSLVPQALTGQLPMTPTAPANTPITQLPLMPWPQQERHNRHTPSIERATQQFVTGLGFVFVALACLFFAPAGRIWWFWLLIPAFVNMGKGIGEYLRLQQMHNTALPILPQPMNAPPSQASMPSAPTTSELQLPAVAQPVAQPASITEHTTALLDAARPKPIEKN